jgi:hypothetical protein
MEISSHKKLNEVAQVVEHLPSSMRPRVQTPAAPRCPYHEISIWNHCSVVITTVVVWSSHEHKLNFHKLQITNNLFSFLVFLKQDLNVA